MAPTRTVKNKHAGGGKRSSSDGIRKPSSSSKSKTPVPTSQVKGRPNLKGLDKKKRKKVYSEKELGIPELNMITPVGVTKPKGKKKGKVFVDDRESMNTILAIVQAEKEGQIESKLIKARQMEEIREARKIEADKKEAERKAKLEETKDSLRKKRKKPDTKRRDEDEEHFKAAAASGSKAAKPKSKKKVSFAGADE